MPSKLATALRTLIKAEADRLHANNEFRLEVSRARKAAGFSLLKMAKKMGLSQTRYWDLERTDVWSKAQAERAVRILAAPLRKPSRSSR